MRQNDMISPPKCETDTSRGLRGGILNINIALM